MRNGPPLRRHYKPPVAQHGGRSPAGSNGRGAAVSDVSEGIDPHPFQVERDVSSVLLLANGGSIFGAAPNAATSAIAIRRQTSTLQRIFARLATLS
jgi:hypothetical protein